MGIFINKTEGDLMMSSVHFDMLGFFSVQMWVLFLEEPVAGERTCLFKKTSSNDYSAQGYFEICLIKECYVPDCLGTGSGTYLVVSLNSIEIFKGLTSVSAS